MALRSEERPARDIRHYSMAWLGRAANRIYERAMEVQAEQMIHRAMVGIDGLFDLSDIKSARWLVQG